eukprot:156461-Rhodomonas_salina.1
MMSSSKRRAPPKPKLPEEQQGAGEEEEEEEEEENTPPPFAKFDPLTCCPPSRCLLSPTLSPSARGARPWRVSMASVEE